MSEAGTRPGGLTALAVLNFVFAAWGFIVAAGALTAPLFMPAVVAQAEKNVQQLEEKEAAAASRANGPESGQSEDVDAKLVKARKDLAAMKEGVQAMEGHKTAMMLVGLARALLSVLLIVSGIGYLKLYRGMGRVIGSIYAIADIALESWAIVAATSGAEQHQQFGLFNLIGFLYPVITLFALNVVFKDDFVR